MKSPATFYAIRLHPGQRLKEELAVWAKTNKADACAIVSCAGSLQKASIRFADQAEATAIEGKHEIVSLSGTLSQHGVHLHISIADSEGRVSGGHLMDGCEIYTTAEIVIAEMSGMVFKRKHDPETGFSELSIERT